MKFRFITFLWLVAVVGLSGCLFQKDGTRHSVRPSDGAEELPGYIYKPEVIVLSPKPNQIVFSRELSYIGTCTKGLPLRITYGPGVEGPVDSNCDTGEFQIPVRFSGNSGIREVTITQYSVSEEASATVPLRYFNRAKRFDATVKTIEPISGDKYLVAGQFATYSDFRSPCIMRLDSHGIPDSSFSTEGNFLTCKAFDVAEVGDGSGDYYAVGDFTIGSSETGVVRLNADGSLDASFSAFNDQRMFSLAVIPNAEGSFYVGGLWEDTAEPFPLFKMLGNGAQDEKFSAVSATHQFIAPPSTNPYSLRGHSFLEGLQTHIGSVLKLTLAPNGELYAGGQFKYDADGVEHVSLIKLDSDGGFKSGGLLIDHNSVFDIAYLASGDLLVAGRLSVVNSDTGGRVPKGLIKINGEGVREESFVEPNSFLQTVTELLLDSSGVPILVAGIRGEMAEIHAFDDSNFIAVTGVVGEMWGLASLANGSFLAVGDFSVVFGRPLNRIFEINSDGGLDNESNSEQVGAGIDGVVYSVAVSSRYVYVGGKLNYYNGVAVGNLVRLDFNGELDRNFNPEHGFDSVKYVLAVGDEGNIYVSGTSPVASGGNEYDILRVLEATGTIDPTFYSAANGSGSVNVMIKEPGAQGKLYVGGSRLNIASRSSLVRLNSDGSSDAAYNDVPGFDAFGPVSAMKFAPDDTGDVYAVGSFNSYGSLSRRGVVRIRPDASLDPVFVPRSFRNTVPANGVVRVYDLEFPTDGSEDVVVVGYFTSYDNIQTKSAARIARNGSGVNTFRLADDEGNSSILAIVIAENGDLLLGGNFNVINGLPQVGVVRLNATAEVAEDFAFDVGYGQTVRRLVTIPDGSGDVFVGGYFSNGGGSTVEGLARIHSVTGQIY